ncbi:class D beta-lactamase [Alkalimonas collagenimarina]|uniref:Beta-lactamase n=1 Tax=Alkalimonas collagenimarina TaxID=400390 RepID=A0ABT9H395_9GAMM|nr:class D beta-lactamase [Alkalimonas collagenimarina]MDP4537796.1 class D beta-lactamase [Alkalimonas collagenimarina]
MKYFLFLLLSICISPEALTQEGRAEKPEWKAFFEKHEATGTIFIVDSRGESKKVGGYNMARASKRYSPASTFKVPHTLFALDAGIVKDEFQVFSWDGVKRGYEPHNQDQNLRSAMRSSALWLYEGFASEIGEEKAEAYLKRIDYGNMDPATERGAYWVDGKLAISATEQVTFLEQLYHNELPFELEHQLLLKDIMIVEAGSNWILRAKTGWEGRYGWWIGWVEWPSGPVFFALNIDTPNRWEDLYKREAIVRDILLSIHALPSNQSMQPNAASLRD